MAVPNKTQVKKNRRLNYTHTPIDTNRYANFSSDSFVVLGRDRIDMIYVFI